MATNIWEETWINFDWLGESQWKTNQLKRPFVQAGQITGRCWKQIILFFHCGVKLTCLLFSFSLHLIYFELLNQVGPYLFASDELGDIITQPQLFCLNEDSEVVSLLWPLLVLGLLFFEELPEYRHCPKFVIYPHLIQRYKQVQLFSAAQAKIRGNQYNFLYRDTN